jgi:hypothetical protein
MQRERLRGKEAAAPPPGRALATLQRQRSNGSQQQRQGHLHIAAAVKAAGVFCVPTVVWHPGVRPPAYNVLHHCCIAGGAAHALHIALHSRHSVAEQACKRRMPNCPLSGWHNASYANQAAAATAIFNKGIKRASRQSTLMRQQLMNVHGAAQLLLSSHCSIPPTPFLPFYQSSNTEKQPPSLTRDSS